MNKKSNIEYEDRLVAFVDILGFKEIIKNSERDYEKIELLYEALNFLKSFEKPDRWTTEIVEIEESTQYKGVQNFKIDHKIQCTTFSDSIVVSIKVGHADINEVASTLISNLSYAGSILLPANILIRGALTVGKLIHRENGIVLGPALIEAYTLESNLAKFPRIILSKKLIDSLKYPYKSKSERFPFHQYVERFDDGCVGFHQMKYFEVVQAGPGRDTSWLKRSLSKIKTTIIKGLDEHFETPDIFNKYEWLKKKYNDLHIPDEKRGKIHDLNEDITGNNIHYSYTDEFYDKKERE